MQVSIVIPTARPSHLQSAITSICKQDCGEWELIVVAQGNDPEMRAFVERGNPDSRVRFLYLKESGLSLARNAGVEAASNPLILFMDDDCEAQADWVRVVTGCFADHPEVGLVGGSLVRPPRPRGRIADCPCLTPSESIYYPATELYKQPAGWGWVGGNFALRRETFDQIGPFDLLLGAGARFPAAEDIDYGMRLERAGIPMLSTPRSVVHHTYGTRYGLRVALKSSASYARGNGAMAAKLTLMGDKRGVEWLNLTRNTYVKEAFRRFRLHRLPASYRRVRVFESAYRECLNQCCVNNLSLLQLKLA